MESIAAALREVGSGKAVFTHAHVERQIEARLARERAKRRKLERERDAAVAELEELRGRLGGSDVLRDGLSDEMARQRREDGP